MQATRKRMAINRYSEENLVNFTTQCKDNKSGETGCFTYNLQDRIKDGYFTATSPVFPDLCDLFMYCNKHKITLDMKK